MEYVSVEEAVALPGLRIAFSRGVPGPWGVAAANIFHIKKIPFVAVEQEVGGDNEALRRWTGQSSAPVAMLDDDRPRAGWAEILLLAESLAPEPALIPADPESRLEMFGLCHEICGEDGLGWNMRLLILAAREEVGDQPPPLLVSRYGSTFPLEHARKRANDLVNLLAARLSGGRQYLVGDSLSAADIYWAAFSNLLAPMTAELCVGPEMYQQFGKLTAKFLDAPVPQSLVDHRDRIVRGHFDVPIDF